MSTRDSNLIWLFDVDGTLTRPRGKISPELSELVQKARSKVYIGLVGGSDLAKISEQISDDVLNQFDYVFSQNGLVAHKNAELIGEMNILKFIGEEKIQKFINFTLKCLSEIELPAKRGTFIEFRKGMINVCPVGRSCSQQERDEFGAYDQKHNIRQNLVATLQKEFPNDGLTFAIGGQISIDVYPNGWDKRFSLQYVEKDHFKTIHFVGDKTFEGGNDYEIYSDPRTIGHSVSSPEETSELIRKHIIDSL